jgi:hypothetical protein
MFGAQLCHQVRLLDVSTTTTTIRVPVQTRDRLAAQARERGISIAALLTELATRAEHEAIFRAERDATRADAAVQAVRDEDHDWDDTIGDGIA